MKRGIYNYFLNGEPTGVIETFEIKFLPDGSKLTTSVRDAKPFNTKITVEAIEKDEKFQNLKIIYQKDENKIEANYEFSQKSFHILRKFNGEIVQNEMFEMLENSIFFPLMRCFQGQTILQVAQTQGFTTVIVPDIQSSTDFCNLLQPTFDERKAENTALGTVKFENHLTDAIVFKYLSQHYDENSEFWIVRKNSLLFHYQFKDPDDKIWSVQLKS